MRAELEEKDERIGELEGEIEDLKGEQEYMTQREQL